MSIGTLWPSGAEVKAWPNDPYAIIRRGTDSSGRAVLGNARMWAAFDEACAKLGQVLTITQGAYMAKVGGGAVDSAGYHDAGGCFDIRVWDLASKGLTVRQAVAALRAVGFAAWLRDPAHGGVPDPHIHIVLLGDVDAAFGALDQMAQYRAGLDGLSSRGPDYHRRPDTIVAFNYKRFLKEDEMNLDDKLRDDVTVKDALLEVLDTGRDVERLATAFATFRSASVTRYKALLAAIDEVPTDAETKKAFREVAVRIFGTLDPAPEGTPATDLTP